MGKLEELDAIERALKDSEIKLKSIQGAIENIDKEIAVLAPKKLELEQNLEFHKKSETIPIAHEYKKAKAELIKVRTRLNIITSDKNKAVDACNQVQEIMDKFRRDQAELLKTNENNVLRPTFGGKHGKV